MRNDVVFNGLNRLEVEQSRQTHGSNDIKQKTRRGFMHQFLSSFGDPIIKILLIALSINLILTLKNMNVRSNWYETAGIAIAVLLATIVSTLSEYGSESAFEKLKEEAARIKCRVKRDNEIVELPVNEIVVGDLILIQAGERIPADGILLSGCLTVDQSTLNGETKEAEKRADHYAPYFNDNNETDLLDKKRLFRGSIACSGEGIMLVKSVGSGTFYGKLADEIQEQSIESPLKSRLRHLAGTISKFGYVAAIIVVMANLFNRIFLQNLFSPAMIMVYLSDKSNLMRDVMEAITIGITVIVMAVPEGLPMMITVVLSSNMRRMLKDNVLVRKLVGIETSGSLNILFTDKTGTLTKGKLEVSSFIDSSGRIYSNLSELKKSTKLYDLVKLNCLYNNGAQISGLGKNRRAIGGNSTDRSLLEFIMNDINDMNKYTKGKIIPFNSTDKLSAVEIIGDKRMFLVKGAPENLLPRCKYLINTNGEKKAQIDLTALHTGISELTHNAVRVIALCMCDRAIDPLDTDHLTLIGFIGIRDELRKEAKSAIEQVVNAGVSVIMITGDNKETAISIAAKAGLLNKDDDIALTGAELAKLSDAELKDLLPRIRVIARALPSDKSRLIRISQELGLVTGMTGDGINDAPALKKADVGFAMGSGTEVAKEAADIVILDNNIASIVKAILYGRTIFKSIRKFIIFQLTVNLCAVCVSTIGPFIGVESPVTVIQMLWINMIMDTLAGLAFAGEAPLAEYMCEAPKNRNEKIINRYMYSQILFTGAYTTLLCLVFLKLPFFRDMFNHAGSHFMTAFFALFIFSGIFNSFNARTYRLNLLAYLIKNKAFIAIMGLVALIQVGLIYYGGSLFRTSGLSFDEFKIILLLSSSVVIADLIRKMILRAYKRKGFI